VGLDLRWDSRFTRSAVFHQRFARLGMSADKKDAAVEESGSRRPKRKKDKLIRLDDLIPKENVKGGRQLLFGVPDRTNNP
jgi:hypothetical protein